MSGKASHAGLQPEMGASAIWDLAQKVAALHALTDFGTGVTVNVGTVRDGERPNVVAAHGAAEIDLRAWSQADAAIAAMRSGRTSPARARALTAASTSRRGRRACRAPSACSRSCVRPDTTWAWRVRAIKTGWGSDGTHTSAIAPRLDGMGPKGSRAHSEEEFIELPTLLERTKMLARFLDRWAAEFEIPAQPSPSPLRGEGRVRGRAADF